MAIIRGTRRADKLNGTNAADTILGFQGNDTLIGNNGSDLLNGGTGKDTMKGGRGNDTYIVDNAGDVVVEGAGAGRDLVKASVSYTLGDNVENLILTGRGDISGTGNAASNGILGNRGDNVITGGAGWDNLSGGKGADSFNDGADTFVYTAVSDAPDGVGFESIRGFSGSEGGEGDKLDFSALVASLGHPIYYGGRVDFVFPDGIPGPDLSWISSGGDTVDLYIDTDGIDGPEMRIVLFDTASINFADLIGISVIV